MSPEGTPDSRAPDADRFDRLAETYDQAIPFFATLGKRLVKWAGPRPGQRILDLGAGRGAVTIAVSQTLGSACDLVAGDVSEQMLGRLRSMNLPGVEVKYLDATALVEADSSFDLVFSAFVLHFLSARAAALAEIARVLRPDGRFAMSVPGPSNDNGWWAAYEQLADEFRQRAGLEVGAAPEVKWEELANAAGLRIIDRSKVEVALPIDGPEAHWQWLQSHTQGALYAALDEDSRAEFRARVMESLDQQHPARGYQLIQGAEFYMAVRARS